MSPRVTKGCLSSHHGRFQEFVKGGHTFFSPGGGAQHPLGPDNPLKTIYFTGPGGRLSPNIPAPESASAFNLSFLLLFFFNFNFRR